jgi:hypothetical protein
MPLPCLPSGFVVTARVPIQQHSQEKSVCVAIRARVLLRIAAHQYFSRPMTTISRLESHLIDFEADPTPVEVQPRVLVEREPFVLHLLRDISFSDACELRDRVYAVKRLTPVQSAAALFASRLVLPP